MGFFTSRSGMEITGDPSKAFAPDFTIIPDGTMATAVIKDIKVEETSDQYKGADKFIKITWKINDGEFYDREVIQKIRAFMGAPEKVDRALNMLKLIMNLCNHRFSHDGEPTDSDFRAMINRVCGIKIREWSMPKQDNSGFLEGNFVSEVHPVKDFVQKTGEKKVRVETAFSRQADAGSKIDDDLGW